MLTLVHTYIFCCVSNILSCSDLLTLYYSVVWSELILPVGCISAEIALKKTVVPQEQNEKKFVKAADMYVHISNYPWTLSV